MSKRSICRYRSFYTTILHWQLAGRRKNSFLDVLIWDQPQYLHVINCKPVYECKDDALTSLRKALSKNINKFPLFISYFSKKRHSKTGDCAQPGCHPCHTFPYTSKNVQRTQHEVLHPSVNGELTSILLPKHHPHMEPAARVCRLSSQLRDLQAGTAVLHLLNTPWNHVLDCT